MNANAWYADPAARRYLLRAYLPCFAGLNLAWELAQLPLYTIWRQADVPYIAFAVLHCTIGDVLIGGAALLLALVLTRSGPLARWQWPALAIVATLIGFSYTVLSEWVNTSIRQSWTYSGLMPVIAISGAAIGVAPIAQWLILPSLILWLTQWRLKRREHFSG